METTNLLKATQRNETGKGASHRLRAKGLVPGIVYQGGAEALSISLHPSEASKLLLTPLKRNVLIHLEVSDANSKKLYNKPVMVRDLQVHPTRRTLTHIDFMGIEVKNPVIASVPLKLSGKCLAVVDGGKLDQIVKKLQVSCLANKIPESITLDVTHLKFGSTHAEDVALPEGLSLAMPAKQPVVTIKIPKEVEEKATTAVAAPVAAAPAAKPAAKK